MIQKNGKMVKWASVILAIIVIMFGWIWKKDMDAKEVAYRLSENETKDRTEHIEFQGFATSNRENIIKLQGSMDYLVRRVDEMSSTQKQVLESQQKMLENQQALIKNINKN